MVGVHQPSGQLQTAALIVGNRQRTASGNRLEKSSGNLFTEPEVTKKEEIDAALKWTAPDEEALIKFMVEDKGFAPERVAAGIKRIKKSKSKGSQGRLDSFFKVTTSMPKAKPSIGKKGGKGGKKKTGPYANR